MNEKSDKIVITVVGKDSIGIIARVCTYLSKHSINILNISQNIVDGFFNMMVIADISTTSEDFSLIASGLKSLGEDMGMHVAAQKEEIFTKMHRI